MRQEIGVGALKDVTVLFSGDIYDLACFLLKMHDAKDKGTTCRSRHTVYGLASTYALISDVSLERIVEVLERDGLPLNATVEYDEDVS